MAEQKNDEVDKEDEEKELLLEYMKLQNEVLKRIYKNAADKENKQ